MVDQARRSFLGHAARLLATGGAATTLGALPATAQAVKPFGASGLRGSLDATQFGVRPGAFDDQSQLLQKVLDRAAREDRPVFLPPGVYVVSNISLPTRARLMGIAGTSRLIYGGGGAFLSGTGCELIEMSGITLDGANRPLGETYGGLLYARACPRVTVEGCE
ncbi:MAG: TIGR03808 family TAT-translocated repetitive protein, partial [Pseudomonadota bacterium]